MYKVVALIKRKPDLSRAEFIDYYVHTGELLERADVPSLAPDDAPLHVVRGNVHRADGRTGGLIRGVPLDRHRYDLAGLGFGLLLEPILVRADLASDLFRQLLRQRLGLGGDDAAISAVDDAGIHHDLSLHSGPAESRGSGSSCCRLNCQ